MSKLDDLYADRDRYARIKDPDMRVEMLIAVEREIAFEHEKEESMTVDRPDYGRTQIDDKAKAGAIKFWHFVRFCLWVFGLFCLAVIILGAIGVWNVVT